MKPLLLVCIFSFSIFIACKKEKDVPGGSSNPGGIPGGTSGPKTLVANAGPDQYPVLPVDSIILDGSASHAPNGQIVEWSWKKISGTSGVTILNNAQKRTRVDFQFTGIFQFELTVKDQNGLIAKDTVAIWYVGANYFCNNSNRPVISSTLNSVWRFPFERFGVATTTSGNKIYFAGGRDGFSGEPLAQVLIFDMQTKQESQASLSMPRAFIGAVSAGTKLFFAGGWTWSGALSRVEIVDIATGQSSIAELSAPRFSVATAVVGNKVFFAGGFYYIGSERKVSSRVDIYDLANNSWSTAELSEARAEMATVVIGQKLYFVGGSKVTIESSAIDVYDAVSGSWTRANLASGVANAAGIAVGSKIYLAGGYKITGVTPGGSPISTHQCDVQVWDVINQTTTVLSLKKSISSVIAARYNDKLVFFPGPEAWASLFEVYNTTTGSWSVGLLPNLLIEGIPFVYNNELYLAGGYWEYVSTSTFNNQILKLEL